jgi:hypothetical protein
MAQKIIHGTVLDYLLALRNKTAKFGKDVLAPYDATKMLCFGFQCPDGIHLIGVNTIRYYYNISHVLPDIPGVICMKNNSSNRNENGVDSFIKSCKEAIDNGLSDRIQLLNELH